MRRIGLFVAGPPTPDRQIALIYPSRATDLTRLPRFEYPVRNGQVLDYR